MAKSNRRRFLAAGGALAVLPAAAAPANETLKTIGELRTTHGNFQDKPLPEAALQTILEASLRTANASNTQSYSIVVVKDRKRMKELCGYAGSCMLLYCADYNRMKASAQSLGYEYDPGTMESFLVACITTSVAAQTAVIAARSLGIDSLLTNGIHRGDMERIWKLAELPERHCFPVIALVLGYTTAAPPYRAGRLEGAGVIHQETYHRLTTDETGEIVRKYDDKQLHLGLNDKWDAEGHKHYLDWFFKVWMKGRLTPDGKETQMLRRLRQAGFVERAV